MLGYTRFEIYQPGMPDWTQRGLPVATGPERPAPAKHARAR